MHYLDHAATAWPNREGAYRTFPTRFSSKHPPPSTFSQLQSARKVLAQLFNIQNPERICFTPGCTQAIHMALQALPWQAGDGLIISAIEHQALSHPVHKIAREQGVEFYIVPYTDTNPFDLAIYEHLLQTRPNIRLVATTHASNVIGCVLPVEQIGRLAHLYGKLFLLDAAQSAGVLNVDVQKAHIDLLTASGHKSLYGPPGIGILYAGENVALNTAQEEEREVDATILALAEGAQWVQEAGISRIHRHEIELLTLLLNGLLEIPEVRLYGHQDVEHKMPVVSFNVLNHTPQALGKTLLNAYDIALGTGFHYAPMAHEAIGSIHVGGTVRASIGYYTQPEDVHALLRALKAILCNSISLA